MVLERRPAPRGWPSSDIPSGSTIEIYAKIAVQAIFLPACVLPGVRQADRLSFIYEKTNLLQ
ncbi:MAG: hypothetical protein A3J48_01070 [Candidatus Doudnabacteria bacterium RIFCSPHIGHO2_02_FULL_46_11]|uniref:Uncharacterized protein n=1 Tax=Candidatus Doudnabacteria bacterium RIFCSPHIGHO2_02_FULL_46_11 TaxID=1817832 RepID=A0A1F5P874_9BACT|nr:MAG: hypothetical protein A3J48_01070 [Candidatus Doudnabacteria bacterium RIFCSPHIGHO2_02_FULL_46_11]